MRERNKSDLPNLALVLGISPYVPTRVFQMASGFNSFHLPWQHSTTEWILLSTFCAPPPTPPQWVYRMRDIFWAQGKGSQRKIWILELPNSCTYCCSLCQDDFPLPLILHAQILHTQLTCLRVQGVNLSPLWYLNLKMHWPYHGSFLLGCLSSLGMVSYWRTAMMIPQSHPGSALSHAFPFLRGLPSLAISTALLWSGFRPNPTGQQTNKSCYYIQWIPFCPPCTWSLVLFKHLLGFYGGQFMLQLMLRAHSASSSQPLNTEFYQASIYHLPFHAGSKKGFQQHLTANDSPRNLFSSLQSLCTDWRLLHNNS